MNFFNQSECFISAKHSNATLKFVHDIDSWFYTQESQQNMFINGTTIWREKYCFQISYRDKFEFFLTKPDYKAD